MSLLVIIVFMVQNGITTTEDIDIIADSSRHIVVKEVIDDIKETGIYLKHLGTISTSPSHYKLIIPFTTEQYVTSLDNIEAEIHNMLATYEEIFEKNTWPNPINISVTKARLFYRVKNVHNRLLSEYQNIKNELLSVTDLFSDINPKRRVDRGLLNFVGEGLSFLFGLSTEDDLKAAKKRVLTSEQTQINIIHSQQHFATIINDQQLQLANLQQTQEKLQNHTATLVDQLKKLVYGEAAQTQEIFKITIFERLETFEASVMQELTATYRKIHKIENAITLALRGSLCPSFVTPDILNKLLIEISLNLPPQFLLPQLTETQEFFKYYKILSVKIEIMPTERKIFVIDIPIINEKDIFQLTHTTILDVPFSPRINTTANIDLKNNKIYATNLLSNQGFVLSPDELTHIKNFQTHYFGDFGKWEMANLSHIKCILSFQNGAFIKENCLNIIKSHSQQHQFYHLIADAWAFSIRGNKMLNISCINDPKHFNSSKIVNLAGFGIIHIPKDCNKIFDKVTIAGIFSDTMKTNVSGISSIAIIKSAPANLAFSQVWSNISNNTRWISSNLTKMKQELQEELGFQIVNTKLHNKTKKLLDSVNSLIQEPIISNENFPWYSFYEFSKIDAILVAFAILSLVANVITYVLIKQDTHKTIFKLFKDFATI